MTSEMPSLIVYNVILYIALSISAEQKSKKLKEFLGIDAAT